MLVYQLKNAIGPLRVLVMHTIHLHFVSGLKDQSILHQGLSRQVALNHVQVVTKKRKTSSNIGK